MNEERPIEGLEELRAPPLDDGARRRLREEILARAELLLARRRRSQSYWDVLAGWARPGLAAAAVALVILAGAIIWEARPEAAVAGPVALEDVLRQTGDDEGVPSVLLTSREPDIDAVAAAVLSQDARAAGQRDR